MFYSKMLEIAKMGKLKIKVIPNKEGVISRLEERDYREYIDTLLTTQFNLISVAKYTTKEEVAEELEDDQLTALDSLYNNINVTGLNYMHNCIEKLAVPIKMYKTAIKKAIEELAIQGGQLSDNNLTLADMIKEHTEYWIGFTSTEYVDFFNKYSFILGVLNFYIYEDYLSNYDMDEEGNVVFYLEKSFNDVLKTKKLGDLKGFLKYNAIVSKIFTQYRPRVGDAYAYPEIFEKFLDAVDEPAYLDDIFNLKEFLTLEMMNSVMEGKLVVNADFMNNLNNMVNGREKCE